MFKAMDKSASNTWICFRCGCLMPSDENKCDCDE